MSDFRTGEAKEKQIERELRALADRKPERVLVDVVTWLESKSADEVTPAMCRLIAMHYDLLAGHREVVGRGDTVAEYRRMEEHWRFRAAALERMFARACPGSPVVENAIVVPTAQTYAPGP